MLCGWIACNIAWWVAMLLKVRIEEIRIQDGATMFLIIGVGAATGLVVLTAWLVIFLPVDLLIPDHSKLRRPWPASICGFLAGSGVIVMLWTWSNWENGSLHHLLTGFRWKELPFMLAPGITGLVAAYMRSRDREPSLKTL